MTLLILYDLIQDQMYMALKGTSSELAVRQCRDSGVGLHAADESLCGLTTILRKQA